MGQQLGAGPLGMHHLGPAVGSPRARDWAWAGTACHAAGLRLLLPLLPLVVCPMQATGLCTLRLQATQMCASAL